MILWKPCAECGELSEQAHCEEHRPKSTKASATTRGYDHAWQKLSQRARRLQPFCSDCGTTEDLTVDHSPEAWQRKEAGKPIRLADVDVVCRACNARRGAARPTPGRPRSEGPRPTGKAEFESVISASGDDGPDECYDGPTDYANPAHRVPTCSPFSGTPGPVVVLHERLRRTEHGGLCSHVALHLLRKRLQSLNGLGHQERIASVDFVVLPAMCAAELQKREPSLNRRPNSGQNRSQDPEHPESIS